MRVFLSLSLLSAAVAAGAAALAQGVVQPSAAEPNTAAIADGSPLFPNTWAIRRYVLRPAGGTEQVVVQPIWMKAPTAAQVSDAWPKLSTATSGDATIRCHVRADGLLQTCRPVSEAPVLQGFASAAMRRLVGQFQLAMPTDDHDLIPNLVVDIPVHFTGPGGISPAVGKVDFEATPDYAALSQALTRAGVTGAASATLNCTVAPGGALTACRTQNETAAGAGRAMAGVASQFHVGLWSAQGLPTVGSRITVPLTVG